MIIKGKSRSGGQQLARYLLSQDDGQQAKLLEYRGTVATDLETAMSYWELEAKAVSRGRKSLYHLHLRLAPGERLQLAQWFETVDQLEQELKLTDQPRAIVSHAEGGETHLHVVYSRLTADGTLINMGNDRRAHHSVARSAEIKYRLRRVSSTPRNRTGNEATRAAEHRMAAEGGHTRQEICQIVQRAWVASNTGREFQELLGRDGITITAGDRRDYVLWHSGQRYSPVRLIETVRAAEFRAKMQMDPPVLYVGDPSAKRMMSKHATRQIIRDRLAPGSVNDETQLQRVKDRPPRGFNKTRRRRDEFRMER